MSDVLTALRRLPICRNLSDAELGEIASLVEEQRIDAGADLFREGDRGDALYLLVEGRVEIVKRSEAGDISLARVGNGSVLGEMSLITDEARSATGKTLTAARVLRLPAPKFNALLRKDSVAALKIVANVAQVLSRRLSLMDEKMVQLARRGGEPRKEELAEFQKILQQWQF